MAAYKIGDIVKSSAITLVSDCNSNQLMYPKVTLLNVRKLTIGEEITYEYEIDTVFGVNWILEQTIF